jgi:protein required for attachment to host cells
MRETASTWILVLDNRRGRLLECGRTPQGRVHLEQRSELENPWSQHEAGGRPEPTTRDKFGRATERHEEEERLLRFAREVAGWLERELGARGVSQAAAFAPARLLGALRRAMPARLNGRLLEHEADLARLGAGELARHPAIASLAPEAGRS